VELLRDREPRGIVPRSGVQPCPPDTGSEVRFGVMLPEIEGSDTAKRRAHKRLDCETQSQSYGATRSWMRAINAPSDRKAPPNRTKEYATENRLGPVAGPVVVDGSSTMELSDDENVEYSLQEVGERM
jgi:hypothetical protein